MRISRRVFFPELTQGELIKGSGNSEKLFTLSMSFHFLDYRNKRGKV